MAKHIISYDLRKDRDYSDLYSALKSFANCRHILESVWILESSKTNKEIADELIRNIDSDDGIVVADYNSYAYRGLLEE